MAGLIITSGRYRRPKPTGTVVEANREMGRLNQIAARLTAVALVLSTLATLVGKIGTGLTYRQVASRLEQRTTETSPRPQRDEIA